VLCIWGPGAAVFGHRAAARVRGEDPRDRKAVNDSQDSSAPRITRPHPRSGTAQSDRVRCGNQTIALTCAGGTSASGGLMMTLASCPMTMTVQPNSRFRGGAAAILAEASCQRRSAADGSLIVECPMCPLGPSLDGTASGCYQHINAPVSGSAGGGWMWDGPKRCASARGSPRMADRAFPRVCIDSLLTVCLLRK
jgi:hypothetical protein